MRFYLTAYGCKALFATLPRSGYNYAMLMLNTAGDLAAGGTGDYSYQDGSWNPKFQLQGSFDLRTPLRFARSTHLHKPTILHTHLPYNQYVVSHMTRKMRVVVLIRNLFDQLESELYHSGYDFSRQKEFLDSGFADSSIQFYNSWGAFLERYEASRLLRFEELILNPYEAVKGLSDFWGLNLPESCVRASVERSSKEEMIRRIPREELATNHRISVRANRGVFSEGSIEFISSRIERELRYDFGYDYSVCNYSVS